MLNLTWTILFNHMMSFMTIVGDDWNNLVGHVTVRGH